MNLFSGEDFIVSARQYQVLSWYCQYQDNTIILHLIQHKKKVSGCETYSLKTFRPPSSVCPETIK